MVNNRSYCCIPNWNLDNLWNNVLILTKNNYMKKILLFLLVLILFVAFNVEAQTQPPSKVGNPEAYLTPDQLAKYQSDIHIANLEKKLQTYGNWVGVGGEVGTAVKEGLMAVVDVAGEFGSTDVGKFTLVMVAWKIMGKDVIRIILGLLFLMIITFIFIKIYNNLYRNERKIIERPSLFNFNGMKKYQVIEKDTNWDGYVIIQILMLFLYAGAIGITYAIMFGS